MSDGTIYNIQRYSLHDGAGIRTVVFFKGCVLRCRWCCNPESQNEYPEISYLKSKCIGNRECNFCIKACEAGAIDFSRDTKAAIVWDKCSQCLRCATECPSGAIRVEGRTVTVSEILNVVEQDTVFYAKGGGLTVSGGEPLVQPDFLIKLLKEAKRRRINVAMETCGYGEYKDLCRAAPFLDMILYDIKSLDNKKHAEWTGKDNAVILENFSRLCADFPGLPKLVRTPVIPEFNENEIRDIADYTKNHRNTTYEPLPYHRFGEGKYMALGRDYYKS